MNSIASVTFVCAWTLNVYKEIILLYTYEYRPISTEYNTLALFIKRILRVTIQYNTYYNTYIDEIIGCQLLSELPCVVNFELLKIILFSGINFCLFIQVNTLLYISGMLN